MGRRLLWSLLVLLLGFQAHAQSTLPNQDVDTSVDSVKVFFDGAQIYRHSTVTVPAGQSTVTFKGLSQYIRNASVQPGIARGPRVISSSVNYSYLSKDNYSKVMQQLLDSLQWVQEQDAAIDAERSGLKAELDLLNKNNKLGGAEGAFTIEDLERAAAFYRKRFDAVNLQLYKLNQQESKLSLTRSRLNSELSKYKTLQNQPTKDVLVTIESPKAGRVTIALQYVVGESGWGARYDIRAASVDEDVNITYMADVYNATGIAWEKVKLTLSTADPSQSAQVPALEPWVLNWDAPLYKTEGYLNTANMRMAPQEVKFEQADEEVVADEGWGDEEDFWEDTEPVDPSLVAVSELMVDYQITGTYSIASSTEAFQVTVREEDVTTSYSYTAVPKVEPAAFLLARLTGWEQLNLIEGSASIYFGGTYIGDSYLDPRSSGDTLSVSLGRDNKVFITRTKQEDFTRRQTIGSKTKEAFAYKISVRNTNASPIEIKILDQVPVSQVSDIEVEITNRSGAKQESRTGQLSWDFILEPAQSSVLEFSYEVKYPKNKTLILRKTRKISRTPRFRH